MVPTAKAGSRQKLRSQGFSAMRNKIIAAVAAAMLMPAVAGAYDQQGQLDSYNLVAGASARYEDNLFRLNSASDAQILLGRSQRSDWVYSEYGGIKVDKPYAQQRFQLDLTAFHSHNQTYRFLDFNGVNYRGAWLWQLTPRVNGELSISQQQSLTPFSDFRGTSGSLILTRRNVQTNESRVFNFDGDLGAGVHLIGGVSELRSRNSQNFTAVNNYVQDNVELGAKYVFPSGNSISLVRREASGDFGRNQPDAINQLDTGFDQHETEAKAVWRITGKSEIDARLDYLQREHDHFASRDFSGMTGNATYRWSPTEKLLLDVTLARNLTSFQEASNSFYETESLTIAPTWLLSPKTTIRLKYDYSDRDYRGAIVFTPQLREDKIQTLSLNADWQATRKILVSGVAQHENRSSNISGLGYTANFIGVSAQLLF